MDLHNIEQITGKEYIRHYKIWREACGEFAKHCDANKLMGGDCIHGEWVFHFSPLEDVE